MTQVSYSIVSFCSAKTMMKYGGIYLDNDIFVLRNLHKYRKYEMAIGWPTDEPMGTQVSEIQVIFMRKPYFYFL